jgi:hypothetical protein
MHAFAGARFIAPLHLQFGLEEAFGDVDQIIRE